MSATQTIGAYEIGPTLEDLDFGGYLVRVGIKTRKGLIIHYSVHGLSREVAENRAEILARIMTALKPPHSFLNNKKSKTMAKTIKDIQELIKERAFNKLHYDLQKMSDTIVNMKLLGYNGDNMADQPKLYQKIINGQSERFQDYDIPQIFYVSESRGRFSGSLFMEKLMDYWLPVYIENETKSFFDRLDQVEQQVQDLLDVNASGEEY